MLVSLVIVVFVLLLGLAVIAAIIAGIVLVVRAASKPSVPQPHPALPATNLPAGWYPDPSQPNLMRYFDGWTWTASTQPRVLPSLECEALALGVKRWRWE